MVTKQVVIAINGAKYMGELGPVFVSTLMSAISESIRDSERATVIESVDSTGTVLLWKGATTAVNGDIIYKCIEAALHIQYKCVESKGTISVAVDIDDVNNKQEMSVAAALRLYAKGHDLFFTRNRQVHQAIDLL